MRKIFIFVLEDDLEFFVSKFSFQIFFFHHLRLSTILLLLLWFGLQQTVDLLWALTAVVKDVCAGMKSKGKIVRQAVLIVIFKVML